MPKTQKTSSELYQEVSDRIVAALKEGTIPWHREWTIDGGVHRSVASKKPYRGVNQFLLDLTAMTKGYKTPWWLTYNKAKKLGGQVRKGEKGTVVVFWKLLFKEDPKDKDKQIVIPMLRHFVVFNIEQCEGDIKAPELPAESATVEERCKAIIDQMPNAPTIKHGHKVAAYASGEDEVRLPHPGSYDSLPGYYTAAYKQLVHSTGHGDRINRKPNPDQPQKEKLIGELGAGMLCGLAGIKVTAEIKNRDAYIDSWVEAFEDDHRLIVNAASKAQGACDYIVPTEDDEADDE